MLQPTIPLTCVPNFRLPNLSRGYALVAKVSVDCAGETFEAKFRVDHLRLLSDLYIPSPGEASKASDAAS